MSAENSECIQCLRKIITRIKAFIQMTPKIFFLLPQKYTNKMGVVISDLYKNKEVLNNIDI